MNAAFSCFPAQGFMTPILENAKMPMVSPQQLDARLAAGWRHFGSEFFRYNFSFHGKALCGVVPLRVRIEAFEESKGQRRILRKNADLETRIVPAKHCAAYDQLFERHKLRFTENVPDSLREFLSGNPAEIPCQNVAVEVRFGRELIAVSFMDLGAESTSSVYGIFDPNHAARSPGIFTLLREIEEARRLGKKFHYLGYAYTVPSVYDYKKRFRAVEAYDWERCWMPLPAEFTWARKVEITGDSA